MKCIYCGRTVSGKKTVCRKCLKEQRKNEKNNGGITSPAVSGKSGKPKKKHGCLKFFIILAAVILAYQGFKKLCFMSAQNKLDAFADKYPFVFQTEDESVDYVLNDFTVPVSYDYCGKQRSVTWTSDSSAVRFDENGNARVRRSENANRRVTVKQEYRFLLGRAEYTYKLTLPADHAADPSEVTVINSADVINHTHDGKMELQVNADNRSQIRYMYGNFEGQKIYTLEDALAVAEAYRDSLGIDPAVTFKDAEYNAADMFIQYTVHAYYNDILLEGSTLKFTVSKNSSEIIKISNCIFDIPENFRTDTDSPDYEMHIKEHIEKTKCIQGKYSLGEALKVFSDNKLVTICEVFTDEGGCFRACVSGGEVTLTDMTQKLYSEAECSGNDERGNELRFTATQVEYGGNNYYVSYVLADLKRKIKVYDGSSAAFAWERFRKDQEEDNGTFLGIVSILAAPHLSGLMTSHTNYFDSPMSVTGYVNLKKAYDYYADRFNRYSYDGKGHPIKVITNCSLTEDNAAWMSGLFVNEDGYFMFNPAKNFKYSMAGTSPDVLAHEYTHAVFDSFAERSSSGIELKGMNEGYADVFGCLSTNTKDWIIVKNVKYLSEGESTADKHMVDADSYELGGRDILHYGQTEGGITLWNKTVSTKYKDDLWIQSNGEEHIISILISHIAAVMDRAPYFDRNGIAKIWYNSMAMGYNSNSTYVDVRKNIINSAENLGYSKEAMDFIAHEFDLEEIFDPSYEITTEEYMYDPAGIDDGTIYSTTGGSVDGHIIFDDTTSKKFFFVMSPLGLMFADTPVLVLMEDKGKEFTDAEIAEGEGILSQVLNDVLSEDPDVNLDIKVTLRVVPGKTIDIINSIFKKSEEQINLSEDGTKEFMSAFLLWIGAESTAYRFYKTIGLI